MSPMRFLNHCIIATSLLAPCAALADVVIINRNTTDPYRNDYKRDYQERYNKMFPNPNRHDPYQTPLVNPPHATEEEIRRDYEASKKDVLQQYAPEEPPITRADLEEILDEKLGKKKKPAAAPTNNSNAFGAVGGLGTVGGVGDLGSDGLTQDAK